MTCMTGMTDDHLARFHTSISVCFASACSAKSYFPLLLVYLPIWQCGFFERTMLFDLRMLSLSWVFYVSRPLASGHK